MIISIFFVLVWVLELSYSFVQFKSFHGISTKKYLQSLIVDDRSNLQKLPWNKNGYKTWNWKGYTINYVDLGRDSSVNKPPLLLVHGFGASLYHWRYNLPALSTKYHVFALDLLGFGLSDKPLVEYNAEEWRDQILDFIQEVVHPLLHHPVPCVVAGNSLGGYAALYAAAANSHSKDLIRACILLNAAGKFRDPTNEQKKEGDESLPLWQKNIIAGIQRFVIGLSFMYTKQPARVSQILKQVYVDSTNVDEDLVASILYPAQDPNAAEVFYRIISKNGQGPPVYVDDLLKILQVPLLLLWGERDPWIAPNAAERIQQLYPLATKVTIPAGHCPHDEDPVRVNQEIEKFMESLPLQTLF